MKFEGEYPPNWDLIARAVKAAAGWKCIRCAHQHDVANGYCLTVHHFDGNKSNCVWWNCLALCQRCHLSIQARVDPQQPYMLEHAEWLKPYVAGFYARKYLGMNCTRDEVTAQLDELLALERVA